MTMDQDIFSTLYLFAFGGLCAWALLAISWSFSLGPYRASLAALCRALWLIPIFACFFPETVTLELPKTLALKPINILYDDSQSMEGLSQSLGDDSPKKVLETLESDCLRLGCLPKVTKLSEIDPYTKDGYTPLSDSFEAWIFRLGSDPWLLMTDGGDYLPTKPWSRSLKGIGRPSASEKTARGMILGFHGPQKENIYIKDVGIPPFSFEGKPLVIDITLKREGESHASERVQVQVLTSDQALSTVNGEFKSDETELSLSATLAPLSRGQHLLTLRALPIAHEKTLWDNTAYRQVEVMPNTVGVLHLLGSPSFDGRFLRRYLKSEPKYDLISFFILRDPWDSQQVNERELSLIPFPVERLFRDELPNFRVVVIQNFALFQFLLPEYQQNLVKFVQDGGGLLFIGGPRALQAADLYSSPLRAILPFETDGLIKGGAFMPDFGDNSFENTPANRDSGLIYDEKTAFEITFADPDPIKRSLANVYDDWLVLESGLKSWSSAKGLHAMDKVKLKSEHVTPLLMAKTAKGSLPLALASYPGKGRAIWIFSESLWRLAMAKGDETSRETYNHFMQSAMTWLTRQDLKKPLIIKNFHLIGTKSGSISWRASLQGPAARYYQSGNDWNLTLCGVKLESNQVLKNQLASDEWELSGTIPMALAGGERCTLDIRGEHPAFGSVSAQLAGVFPESFRDDDLEAAPQKLEELARLTGAKLSLPPQSIRKNLSEWVEEISGTSGIALPSRFRSTRNFYWIFDQWWVFFLLMMLPFEVLIRRWDQLATQRR